MVESILLGLLLLTIVIPFGIFAIISKKTNDRKSCFKRTLLINVSTFFAVVLLSTIFIFTGNVSAAETESVSASGMAFLGAALSVGLGSIGTGIATGQAASSALGAMSENEGIMGKALLFVALAEGIAIYGLLIAFMILNKV